MIRILRRLGYTFYFQSYILFYFILKIQAKKHQFTTNLIINYFYNNNVIVDKNYYEASKKKPIINIFSLLLFFFFFSLKHCSCIPKKKNSVRLSNQFHSTQFPHAHTSTSTQNKNINYISTIYDATKFSQNEKAQSAYHFISKTMIKFH